MKKGGNVQILKSVNVVVSKKVELLSLFGLFLLTSCYNRDQANNLNQDLGFTHHSPYIDGVEIFSLYEVEHGGVFQQAGFEKGDRIDQDLSIGEFYKKLENHRGRSLKIKVFRMRSDQSIELNLLVDIPE